MSQNPQSPRVFFLRSASNQLFYTFSPERLLLLIENLLKASKANILLDFSESQPETLSEVASEILGKKNIEEIIETTLGRHGGDQGVYAIDEKKVALDRQKKSNQSTLNETLLTEKKNYPLNDKKNYPLNDKPCSLSIDLAKKEGSPIQTEKLANFCETTQKKRNSCFFDGESLKNKENQTETGLNIQKLKEALLKGLQNPNSFKIKKNAEELPGIIAYFELKRRDGITLSHRKFTNEKGQSKVEITILTSEEKKPLAEEIVDKFKNYYFFKEIMLSHRKDCPFDLNRDFSEIKAEGGQIQNLLAKMIQNMSLKIDEELNFELIEHFSLTDDKKNKKNPRFPYSMLFYWKKELRRSEIRRKINEIKEKIKEYHYVSLFCEGAVDFEAFKSIRAFIDSQNELAISEVKNMEIDKKTGFSFSLIGRTKNLVDVLRNFAKIKRISMDKGRFETDYQFQMRVDELKTVCFGAGRSSIEFENENYVAYVS